MKRHTTLPDNKPKKHTTLPVEDDILDEPADTEKVGKVVRKIRDYFIKKENDRIATLIPGNPHKDLIVLARRSRLAMIQIHYNAGKITEDEAREKLKGELSPGKPETNYDDSFMLSVKKESKA